MLGGPLERGGSACGHGGCDGERRSVLEVGGLVVDESDHVGGKVVRIHIETLGTHRAKHLPRPRGGGAKRVDCEEVRREKGVKSVEVTRSPFRGCGTRFFSLAPAGPSSTRGADNFREGQSHIIKWMREILG